MASKEAAKEAAMDAAKEASGAAPAATPKKPAAETKKKGRLPLLIVLVAVLATGGFFGMKMKGGAKPKLELGEIVQLQEILVNLKDPNAYARTDISLHLQKGFEKKKLEDKIDAVRDAIILTLTRKSLADLKTLEGKILLKREIASAINGVFAVEGHAAKEPSASKSRTGEADLKGDGKSGDGKPGAPTSSESSQKDWDSDTGPVLKVYFANFATQ